MPVINHYSFGSIILDGTTYTKDIIIFPDDSILCPWWRNSGHRLEINDIAALISINPDVIVAGTGSNGLMHPSGKLHEFLKVKNIEFVALPTDEAVQVYNDQALKKSTGGCFHLTC